MPKKKGECQYQLTAISYQLTALGQSKGKLVAASCQLIHLALKCFSGYTWKSASFAPGFALSILSQGGFKWTLTLAAVNVAKAIAKCGKPGELACAVSKEHLPLKCPQFQGFPRPIFADFFKEFYGDD